MRQKHPKHPANSGRPHPPVLFIFENIERVDLALIFFSSLLVLTILGGIRYAPQAIPWLVGLVITAAYWFTASTFLAILR